MFCIVHCFSHRKIGSQPFPSGKAHPAVPVSSARILIIISAVCCFHLNIFNAAAVTNSTDFYFCVCWFFLGWLADWLGKWLNGFAEIHRNAHFVSKLHIINFNV